jgi:hypothetical protein
MLTSALSLVNLVLTLLNSFVQWGARTKVFKEDEAIIASQVLTRVLKDIEDAKNAREAINREFADNPDSVMQPDEFTRPPKDKRPGT